jgi:lysine 2,3-aminomutase
MKRATTPLESDEPPSLDRARRATRASAPPGAAFRRRHYPGVSLTEWNDWRWQLKNRVTSREQLERFIELSDEEKQVFSGDHLLPLSITPYYLSLVDPTDPTQPLRRSVVPTCHEQLITTGEEDDPLGEEADSPVPGLVHRYPDRVLFLATRACSVYCRYCTRSRIVGHHGAGSLRQQWERSLAYVRSHPEVRDVLVSGGDPLTLPDASLEWLLTRLRAIPSVEIIRIGSKVPAVLPQRVTRGLVRLLRRFHPLWLSLHFTHPDELTPEAARACARLADAGIPLGSQTVLLRGINDNVPTMKALVQGLLRMRVRPYYLYQCDPIRGSAHFRTPVQQGLEIIRGLRGHTTGYAVPTFVIDAPAGGGKIPLLPQYCLGKSPQGDQVVLQNYTGAHYYYPDSHPL